MAKVKLLFSDERDLRRFLAVVAYNSIEMNIADLWLVCDYSEADIELAIKAFNAIVAEQDGTVF